MTKIEWATETWNPITGCSPVSEGCQNCYAQRMAQRLKGRYGYPKDEPFTVTFHPDRLDQPLRWKKPRMIFVCSMGDLFHEKVAQVWIDYIFVEIRKASHHTFLVLTKRPERMAACIEYYARNPTGWPFPNLWLGVTAENQQRADERIPILLQIPATVRFVSIEPMLSQVDLIKEYFALRCNGKYPFPQLENKYRTKIIDLLDWVIVGGETGLGARPMHPDWVRSVRDQCQESDTPFFFKQWGEFGPATGWRIGKKKAGRMLDGREWNEYPKKFNQKGQVLAHDTD